METVGNLVPSAFSMASKVETHTSVAAEADRACLAQLFVNFFKNLWTSSSRYAQFYPACGIDSCFSYCANKASSSERERAASEPLQVHPR